MRRSAALLIMSLLVSAGCGDDSGVDETLPAVDETTTTSETAPPSSTSTTLSPEAAAEHDVSTAYLAAWDGIVAASDPPDPASIGLVAVLMGDALEVVRTSITGLQERGQSLVGEITHDVHVQSLAGETAVVFDCTVDGLHERPTGEPPDPAIGTVELGHEARMRKTVEGWKVERMFGSEEACA